MPPLSTWLSNAGRPRPKTGVVKAFPASVVLMLNPFCSPYVGSISLTELPRWAAWVPPLPGPPPAKLPAVFSGIRPLRPMTMNAKSGL